MGVEQDAYSSIPAEGRIHERKPEGCIAERSVVGNEEQLPLRTKDVEDVYAQG